MSKNDLAHLKHRNPAQWRAMDVAARWFYDEGWHDATALLVKRELHATVETENDESAVGSHSD